jgi:hypothetical protein
MSLRLLCIFVIRLHMCTRHVDSVVADAISFVIRVPQLVCAANRGAFISREGVDLNRIYCVVENICLSRHSKIVGFCQECLECEFLYTLHPLYLRFSGVK